MLTSYLFLQHFIKMLKAGFDLSVKNPDGEAIFHCSPQEMYGRDIAECSEIIEKSGCCW